MDLKHLQAAADLGMEHSEAERDGQSVRVLHAGFEIAAALEIEGELTSEDRVALRDAYQGGRRDFW